MRVAIVLFWLGMTAAVVRRDLLPRLGYGDLNYAAVLRGRAVDEQAYWTAFRDGQRVGQVITSVRPDSQGAYILSTQATVSTSLFTTAPGAGSDSLQARSDFHVSPLGKLQRFSVYLSLVPSSVQIDVKGAVEGRTLELSLKSPPIIDKNWTMTIDPEALVLDPFGPLDRLPGLRLGKSWTTRAVNPLSSGLLPGFLGSGSAIDVIEHRVVDVATLSWNEQDCLCYLVEHQHGKTVARTWARTSDFRVLKQEIPFGGVVLQFVLDASSIKGD